MYFKEKPPLALVFIGPLIVAILFAFVFIMKPRPVKDLSGEEIVIVFGVIWTTVPFIVLKFFAARSILSWMSAFLLMLGFYLFAAYDAATRANERSGPNIGLGLLFIALPFLVSSICLVINRLALRYETRDSELR